MGTGSFALGEGDSAGWTAAAEAARGEDPRSEPFSWPGAPARSRIESASGSESELELDESDDDEEDEELDEPDEEEEEVPLFSRGFLAGRGGRVAALVLGAAPSPGSLLQGRCFGSATGCGTRAGVSDRLDELDELDELLELEDPAEELDEEEDELEELLDRDDELDELELDRDRLDGCWALTARSCSDLIAVAAAFLGCCSDCCGCCLSLLTALRAVLPAGSAPLRADPLFVFGTLAEEGLALDDAFFPKGFWAPRPAEAE